MISERIRQVVLEQMGITPWFPRVHVPGAAASHPQTRRALREVVRARGVAVPEGGGAGAAAEVAGSTVAAATDRTAPVGASTLQRLLQDAPAVPPSVTVAPPAVTAVTAAQPSATKGASRVVSTVTPETVNFAFCWIDLDEHLAIVAELPRNSRRLSREAKEMVVNITAALNPRYRIATPREHNFHWPFVVAPDLPADAQAAQQAVDGFISRRLQEHKVSHVLLLSDSMPFYLAGGLSDDPAALHQHGRHGFRLLQTHALHAMLSDATLKRSAWQAMQPLVTALQNTSDGI